jgi:hypothetical protein
MPGSSPLNGGLSLRFPILSIYSLATALKESPRNPIVRAGACIAISLWFPTPKSIPYNSRNLDCYTQG